MNLALETVSLSKRYVTPQGTITVLDDVSLKVPEGKFVALTGRSGCGKTTLLQLLGALDSPTSGEVLCFGESVTKMGVFRRAKFRLTAVGFVFQSYQLFPELTAFENVMLAARLSALSLAEGRERTKRLLEQVGMADRAEHHPAELSGGEQQRIAIARALINNPRLVLADEPTGNLDPKNSQDIIEILRALQREQARTILMVTHNRELASGADLVYVMERGTVHR